MSAKFAASASGLEPSADDAGRLRAGCHGPLLMPAATGCHSGDFLSNGKIWRRKGRWRGRAGKRYGRRRMGMMCSFSAPADGRRSRCRCARGGCGSTGCTRRAAARRSLPRAGDGAGGGLRQHLGRGDRRGPDRVAARGRAGGGAGRDEPGGGAGLSLLGRRGADRDAGGGGRGGAGRVAAAGDDPLRRRAAGAAARGRDGGGRVRCSRSNAWCSGGRRWGRRSAPAFSPTSGASAGAGGWCMRRRCGWRPSAARGRRRCAGGGRSRRW